MKLNFGCGDRLAPGWENIDFHSTSPDVHRVNLLHGFPYQDSSMSAVYSSHVLEHFDKSSGGFLLRESWRVLKKDGILRLVVPDLQATCAEYMRILTLENNGEKQKLYSWIIIELLDQMVRNTRSGEMGKFAQGIASSNDSAFKDYIISRTQHDFLVATSASKAPLLSRLRQLTFQIVMTKFVYVYLKCLSHFLPRALRSMVMVDTAIGERHRWMYDEYGLTLLCKEAGFSRIQRVTCHESAIPHFSTFYLDCEPDGTPYKRNSLFLEAVK